MGSSQSKQQCPLCPPCPHIQHYQQPIPQQQYIPQPQQNIKPPQQNIKPPNQPNIKPPNQTNIKPPNQPNIKTPNVKTPNQPNNKAPNIKNNKNLKTPNIKNNKNLKTPNQPNNKTSNVKNPNAKNNKVVSNQSNQNLNTVVNQLPNGIPDEFKSIMEGFLSQIPPNVPIDKSKLSPDKYDKLYKEMKNTLKTKLKEIGQYLTLEDVEKIKEFIAAMNIFGLLNYLKNSPNENVQKKYDEILEKIAEEFVEFLKPAVKFPASALVNPTLIKPILNTFISTQIGGRNRRKNK